MKDLVLIKYEKALEEHFECCYVMDLILLISIDDRNKQFLGEMGLDDKAAEDELVFDDDPLTWGAVADATRASESFTYTIWQIRPKKTASTASYNLGVS